MVETPELTSMTRRRSVRPLLAAWILVFVLLGTGFIWLSQSEEQTELSEKAPDAMSAQADNHDISLPDKFPSTTEINQDITQAATVISQNPESATLAQTALTKAPIAGLTMKGANGLLPVLGPDSMVSWKEYARPYHATADRPKIAIIVTGIGLNSKASELAITTLPGEFDLGFSPYGHKIQDWMSKSRQYGHEGFLMIPTEPVQYPKNDPGPHTLLAGAPKRDNLKRLDWLLSQMTGYVGVINEMGSKLTASEDDMLPILQDLKERGLMFLDSRSSRFSVAAKLARRISMPRAINNLYIDNVISANDIAQNLSKLENTARSYGTAVGVARAMPLTIRELRKWAEGLDEHGFELVPITAIANRQPVR